MTDDQLRALVRDAVARHLAAQAPTPASARGAERRRSRRAGVPSFHRYALPRGPTTRRGRA